MNIFDNIKKVATKTAKDAVKVSGDAVEYTKLRFKLAEINDKINSEYLKIGEEIYKSSIGIDIDEDSVKESCSVITELKVNAKDIESEISELTNKTVCPYCNTKNLVSANYCSKCGER